MSLTARVRALERRAETRRVRPEARATLAALRADPAQTLTRAGMTPDPWQTRLLRGSWNRALFLASRQIGKSETGSAVALHTALTQPGSLVLITAPSLRQATECYRKAATHYERLGRPVPGKVNATFMELANGSRLLAVPGSEKTIRGFSAVSLIVLDEAARVPDALLAGMRPMLAVSGGKLLAMSTPFGRRGWFYDEFTDGSQWHRERVTAEQCHRITPRFLADERRALGETLFRQEYLCSFEDNENAVFDADDILSLGCDEPPLFPLAV